MQKTFKRAALGLAAASALAASSVLIASPASAVQPLPEEIFEFGDMGGGGYIDWPIPVGVHSVVYTVQGGKGGDVDPIAGPTSFGGNPATVTGTLIIPAGNTTLRIWVGEEGENGGLTQPGDGGVGFNDGGDGADSGVLVRPGAGGGGSSAIQLLPGGDLGVHAGGGGGAGGRGSILLGCLPGDGGDAGFAGESATVNQLCPNGQVGGAAGANPTSGDVPNGADGQDATNVPNPVVNTALGGSGGGGGGGGLAGSTLVAPLLDTGGGAGGGGGGSLGDAWTADGFDPEYDGDGFVSIIPQLAYITETTAVAAPNPANPGNKITVTATVDNTESNDDPTGTVDFGIAGCLAVPLVGGTAGDGLATAVCEYTAGDPSSITYDIFYDPLLGSPFGGSSTSLKIDIVAALAHTGLGSSLLIPAGGAALVLLLGGAVLILRRRAA